MIHPLTHAPIDFAALLGWAETVIAGPEAPFCDIRGMGGWAVTSRTGGVQDGFVREHLFDLAKMTPGVVEFCRDSGFRHDLDQLLPTPVMGPAIRQVLADHALLYPCRVQLQFILGHRAPERMIADRKRPAATMLMPLRAGAGWRLEMPDGVQAIAAGGCYLMDAATRHRFVNEDGEPAYFLTAQLYDLHGLTALPCTQWASELRLRDQLNQAIREKTP